jgi:type VII secretion-associated serine protease mycosin
MKMRLLTVFGFLAGMALLVPVVLALTMASPDGLANAAPPAITIAGAQDVEPAGHIDDPARAASTQNGYAYTVDLSPVAKAYMGCTSIYTVTNQSVISAAFTVHEFFEVGVPTAVFSFTDTINPVTSIPYDLADISGLPGGFTGTLTINSNYPITATLEPCPSRTYYVYLPLVARDWEHLPEPVIPNDTYYSTYQWNLPQIRAPYAWAVSTGSSDVIVAVLDSGADLTHPDLQGQLVAGYDFVNGDDNPSDNEGHGTHVAGIVAAHTNNGQGVAGVAWGSKIMPVKVLDWRGRGTHSQGADGIIWATGQGARIINLSLGGESSSATLQNAVNYAYDHGVLVVAAAGNEYEEGNPVIYPAAYPHVLAVAATGDQDEHADYSETGTYVDVAAPGGNPSSSWDANPDHWILSTYWRGAGYGEYLQVAGTSQAAPHVAGLAALVWSVSPSLSNDQVEQVIEETAVDLGNPGRDDVFGHGRIDAYAALVRASCGASASGMGMTVSSLPSADTLSSPTHHVPLGGTERTEDEFEAGVILVKFKTGVSEESISSALAKYSAQITGQIPALGVLRLSVPEGREVELSEQLSQDPAVEYAEPDYVVYGF